MIRALPIYRSCRSIAAGLALAFPLSQICAEIAEARRKASCKSPTPSDLRMALAPFRLVTSTARGRLVGTSQDDDRRVLARRSRGLARRQSRHSADPSRCPRNAWFSVPLMRHSNQISTNASLHRRETQFSRAETKTPKRSLQSNRQIAETKCVHKSPPVRGDSHRTGKSPFVQDCVVADAVAVEPVSQVKFPANREINREFCQFSPDSQPALLSSRNDSAGLEWKFPTHSNRE